MGIARLVIDESVTELRVTGFDGDGDQVAEVHVQVGVYDVPEWDTATLGRAIDLEIAGKRYDRFTSAGLTALSLPRPTDETVEAFLLDSTVAAALARHGVGWAPARSVPIDETAYSTGQCQVNSGVYPAPCGSVGRRSECIERFGEVYDGATYDYTEQWMQHVVCNNNNRVIRFCTYAYGPTDCGQAGPQGCAVCSGYAFGSGGTTYCSGGYNGSCAFQD